MSTRIFHEIIYGPVHSRRLGVSLGVNLLPPDGKLCTFDCIYCECGRNAERRTHTKLPSREEVKAALVQKLTEMKAEGILPNVITFAGNGEPTMHPEFEGIIDDTIIARNEFAPNAKIAVLSNSTTLDKASVFRALNRIEDNIMKLDSVLDSRIQQMNAPNVPTFNFTHLSKQLCQFNGNIIIQTMFLRGEVGGAKVDNTTEEEISGWLQALKQINPKQVMIYTIDRETPVQTLYKVPREEMEKIADRARTLGCAVSVSA